MEIQPKLQLSQSSIMKEPSTEPVVTKVAGAYSELKEKSKGEILSVSEKALVSAIDKANQAVQGTPHEFNYKVHESGRLIVQVLNKHTHELLKEFPSEKFIELIDKLQELTVGAIIDEKG